MLDAQPETISRGWGPAGRTLVLFTQTLAIGGAQRQLVTLARELTRQGRSVRVIVSYPPTALADELRDAGITVDSLGKRSRWDLLGYSQRLVQSISSINPAIIYSYLDAANLLTLFVKPFARNTKTVWGVRAGYVDLGHYDWFARLLARMVGLAAQRADLVLFNSRAAARLYRERGYNVKREVVIPNGIDTDSFYFDERERKVVRQELGISENDSLIGLVGRLDPQKDHRTFLRAIRCFFAMGGHARFACIGPDSHGAGDALKAFASDLGVGDRVVWAGERSDMRAIYSALDLHTSTSIGEGFSNAIAESMACGVCNVVTDVGDSADIVGDAGFVVPTENPEGLATGWKRALAVPQDLRAARSRSRVESRFSVHSLAANTSRALDELLKEGV
jgi:glycosyltransferase involved in cell wall biosynthesis